jgi:hypothetical protein
MSDSSLSAQDEASERPSLDARLVQWMAVQALQDRYARLVDGGADIDARIELAALFLDLPVSAPCRTERTPEPLSKCIWCEQLRPPKRELDVEHYRPKVRVSEWEGKPPVVSDTPPREIDIGPGYWWLAFEWKNYSLSCKPCNQGWKRNVFPVALPRAQCVEGVELIEKPLLLDPGSSFRTREHFRWNVDGIVEPTSSEGYATIVTCGLNRKDLTVRRGKIAVKTLKALDSFVRSLRYKDEAGQRDAFGALRDLGSRSEEFTSMVRWFVEERLTCLWDDLEGMPP